jgi:hypothetical protein
VILHTGAWASAAAAVRAARSLEVAVHAEVVVHIRRAREAGESWAAIGALLGFGPVAAAEGSGTLEQFGYDYAAGPRTVDPQWPVPQPFTWTCPGCSASVADYGSAKGPRIDQDGHKDGCVRLAAEAAGWDQEH